ncbi:MAG: hypothetical protein JW791_01515 [Nanoarchaeota archaeon]|nr:hypothetical protein [Nanoarchaeota archaeon]
MSFEALYAKLGKKDREYYFTKGVLRVNPKNIEVPPVLALHLNRVCYNKCERCSLPSNGEELNYLPAIKYLDYCNDYFMLSGGEPLLSKDFKDVLNAYKISKKRGTFQVLTGGLNPNVNETVKELYANNLEALFSFQNSGNYLALIIYSFFEGVEPEKRLTDFLELYKSINKNYKQRIGLEFCVVSDNDEEAVNKANFVSKNFHKILGIKLTKDLLFFDNVYSNGRTGEVIFDSECDLFNAIIVSSNGLVRPCCSNVERGEYLPPAGRTGEEFIPLRDKLYAYYGLIQEFQEESGSNKCVNCINKLPAYLINKLEGLK